MEIYDSADFETEFKKDDSPLTRADLESNRVIMSYLTSTNIPIISEEKKTLIIVKGKTGIFVGW